MSLRRSVVSLAAVPLEQPASILEPCRNNRWVILNDTGTLGICRPHRRSERVRWLPAPANDNNEGTLWILIDWIPDQNLAMASVGNADATRWTGSVPFAAFGATDIESPSAALLLAGQDVTVQRGVHAQVLQACLITSRVQTRRAQDALRSEALPVHLPAVWPGAAGAALRITPESRAAIAGIPITPVDRSPSWPSWSVSAWLHPTAPPIAESSSIVSLVRRGDRPISKPQHSSASLEDGFLDWEVALEWNRALRTGTILVRSGTPMTRESVGQREGPWAAQWRTNVAVSEGVWTHIGLVWNGEEVAVRINHTMVQSGMWVLQVRDGHPRSLPFIALDGWYGEIDDLNVGTAGGAASPWLSWSFDELYPGNGVIGATESAAIGIMPPVSAFILSNRPSDDTDLHVAVGDRVTFATTVRPSASTRTGTACSVRLETAIQGLLAALDGPREQLRAGAIVPCNTQLVYTPRVGVGVPRVDHIGASHS